MENFSWQIGIIIKEIQKPNVMPAGSGLDFRKWPLLLGEFPINSSYLTYSNFRSDPYIDSLREKRNEG